MDNRFLFSPVYSCWNKILPYYHSPVAPRGRIITPLISSTKKAVAVVAIAIVTIASGIFSLISFPIRYYQKIRREENWHKFERRGFSSEDIQKVRKEVRSYLQEHPSLLSKSEKKEAVEKITTYYLRSKKVYGPIVRTWVETLLEKGNQEKRKLIFMARDGIAPYKMAKKLMRLPEYKEKYPHLAQEDQIELAYISRKVVREAESEPEKFKAYVSQLGIKENDQCYFVDIGFEGSMIATIRSLLPLGVVADFEYLISLTDRANGFLATRDHQLQSVPSAGSNLGVHWLEDTHQGTGKSPSSLVRQDDGFIYPNTKTPGKKERCVVEYSMQHLLRRFCKKAIVSCIDQNPLKETDLKKAKQLFDDTIFQIKRQELPLLVDHL